MQFLEIAFNTCLYGNHSWRHTYRSDIGVLLREAIELGMSILFVQGR